MSNTKRNIRLIGLDYFRIMAAFVVFMFHSNMHIGCDYGSLKYFVQMGAIYMTGFFMLSGYLLFYTNKKYDLTKLCNITPFFKKRLIGILPLYYISGLLFELLLGTTTLGDNVILFPVEVLGLQAVFTSISRLTHNGGTWFISCLLLCYLVFPFLQEVTKQLKNKNKLIVGFVCSFILLYAPLIQIKFGTYSIYENPIFRIIEFFIGVLLASMKEEVEVRRIFKPIFSKAAFFVESCALVVMVSYAVQNNLNVGNYMFYNIFAFPLFVLMIISLSGITCKNSKVVRYLSDISYAFFLAQFFTWQTTREIISFLGHDSNWLRIVISLSVCIFYSVLLHELVEKPALKLLKR